MIKPGFGIGTEVAHVTRRTDTKRKFGPKRNTLFHNLKFHDAQSIRQDIPSEESENNGRESIDLTALEVGYRIEAFHEAIPTQDDAVKRGGQTDREREREREQWEGIQLISQLSGPMNKRSRD